MSRLHHSGEVHREVVARKDTAHSQFGPPGLSTSLKPNVDDDDVTHLVSMSSARAEVYPREKEAWKRLDVIKDTLIPVVSIQEDQIEKLWPRGFDISSRRTLSVFCFESNSFSHCRLRAVLAPVLLLKSHSWTLIAREVERGFAHAVGTRGQRAYFAEKHPALFALCLDERVPLLRCSSLLGSPQDDRGQCATQSRGVLLRS